jgi:hypothetical protein
MFCLPPDRAERGAGLMSMALGLFFFFGFLVFAVNVTYNLYATSVITSLALDAAHDVAERNGLSPSEAEAEFREHVGGEVEFSISVNGDTVQATVLWETRSLLPQISSARAFGVIDRTFEVRVEEQQ